MECKYCGYEWETRIEKPKSCPRCKRRFDYPKIEVIEDISIPEKKKRLILKAKTMKRGFERTIYVMSLITSELERYDIQPVIIGGSAVEFYTRNWYATGDVDLAVSMARKDIISKVLQGFGFARDGRMWINREIEMYLETPGSLKEINKEKIVKVRTDVGIAYVIGIEDILYDRIEAAKYWKSTSDEEQAIRLGVVNYEDIDWRYLKKRCLEDNSDDKFNEIKKRIECERNKIRRMESEKRKSA